jgi:carboxymethylenebutenolidase
MDPGFAPDELRLIELWERHMHCELAAKDAAATVETTVEASWVNHVPVMTGGTRPDEVLDFYAEHFIPKMPADTAIELVCRTVGAGERDRRAHLQFTHDLEMD